MPQHGEMLDTLKDTGAIVDIERAVCRPRGPGVDKDRGNPFGIKTLEKKLFAAKGHDGNPVYLPFEHTSHAALHLVRIVAR